MASLRRMKAYTEDCKKDPDLQSFDDKCRTCFDAVMRSKGDGHGGIQIGQLKEVISFVCEMNKGITDTIMTYEDEIVKLMAGEEECLKFVEQYFHTTSEMLAFCTELDRFVVSARNSHSYIAHVIQKLQTDYGMETSDDVDDNGAVKGTGHYMARLWKLIINIFDNYLAGNIISRNRFRRIVEVLENLKGSDMVSRSDSAESLVRSIHGLQKKFDDMFKALQRYDIKLQKKLQVNRSWKRITNMMFVGSMVCAGVLSLCAVATLLASPHLAVLAGTELIGPAVTMLVGNPNTVFATGIVLKCSIPVLQAGKHWASSLFDRNEDNIRNQQEVVDSMKDGAQVAIKELGDIRHLIDSLLVHIDSIVKNGKFGLSRSKDHTVSFAVKAIKDDLGIFLEKIEELEKEQKRCTSEILKARDDVLAKLTSKVEVVKKGKQV